eukprot:Nitzschia sp. Nitz4//scaffold377_size13714//3131//5194//NITZ4_008969-RA/size13714-processed-gene-0.13-mRNA-1//-1//CDS//3329549674//3436//frame0
MFRRVRESISSRAQAAAAAASQRPRRRLKNQQHASSSSYHANGDPNETPTSRRRRRRRQTEDASADTIDSDDDRSVGNMSVRSTVTVETTRTDANENRKPLADPTQRLATQVLVRDFAPPTDHEANANGSDDDDDASITSWLDPVEVLKEAHSDITKLNIYLQELTLTRPTTTALVALVRGDNRSWEAIAVDMLRQKARWESITIENVRNESDTADKPFTYLDSVLALLLQLDNCAYLHFSQFSLSFASAQSLNTLAYSKSLTKLQLDLIDLSTSIPSLSEGLLHNTSIKELIASRCGLNDDQLGILLSSLPKYLEELRLFGNKCRNKGLEALADVLRHSQHLKLLDLSYQHVEVCSDPSKRTFDVNLLFQVLKTNNKTLRVFDLDNTGIDDDQLTCLCEALCVNVTLEQVMLNHNRISATGIGVLARHLGTMKGLKKISMYSNLFDAPQAEGAISESNGAAAKESDHRKERSSSRQNGSGNLPPTENGHVPRNSSNNSNGARDETKKSTETEDGESENDGDDDSSAPPPSADFREPDKVKEDEALEDDNNEGSDNENVDNSSSPPPSTDFQEDDEANEELDQEEDDNHDKSNATDQDEEMGDDEEVDSVLGIIVN